MNHEYQSFVKYFELYLSTSCASSEATKKMAGFLVTNLYLYLLIKHPVETCSFEQLVMLELILSLKNVWVAPFPHPLYRFLKKFLCYTQLCGLVAPVNPSPPRLVVCFGLHSESELLRLSAQFQAQTILLLKKERITELSTRVLRLNKVKFYPVDLVLSHVENSLYCNSCYVVYVNQEQDKDQARYAMRVHACQKRHFAFLTKAHAYLTSLDQAHSYWFTNLHVLHRVCQLVGNKRKKRALAFFKSHKLKKFFQALQYQDDSDVAKKKNIVCLRNELCGNHA